MWWLYKLFDNKFCLCVRLSANALERSVPTATQALRHYGDAMPAASLCATPVASILNCTMWVYTFILYLPEGKMNNCKIEYLCCAFLQVNRPLTMKKDGIQTRNRKVSNRNKKGKKGTVSEVYPDMSHIVPPDEHVGPYSLNPGPLLSYSHTPHLLPPSTLHSSPTLSYSHHPNSGMMPTLVWRLDHEACTLRCRYSKHISCINAPHDFEAVM